MSAATFGTTFRGDVKKIAAIKKYLNNKGIYPLNRNQLLNMALNITYDAMLKEDPSIEVKDLSKAYDIMASFGRPTTTKLDISNSIGVNKDFSQALEIVEQLEGGDLEE